MLHPLQQGLITPGAIVPASCFNAAASDAGAWASQPVDPATGWLPVEVNAETQECGASGTPAAAAQLWTQNVHFASSALAVLEPFSKVCSLHQPIEPLMFSSST